MRYREHVQLCRTPSRSKLSNGSFERSERDSDDGSVRVWLYLSAPLHFRQLLPDLTGKYWMDRVWLAHVPARFMQESMLTLFQSNDRAPMIESVNLPDGGGLFVGLLPKTLFCDG
jgi:hypothetical protein